MIHKPNGLARITFAGLLLLLHLAWTKQASSQTIPAEMEAALERVGSLDPVSIQWKSETSYAGASGMQLTTTYQYGRHHPRFHYRHEQVPTRGVPFILDYRFDGKVMAGLHGKQSATWYKIEGLVQSQPRESRFRLNYCDAVGIHCPLRMKELADGRVQSSILRLLRMGGDLVSVAEVQQQEDDEDLIFRIEIEAEDPFRAELIAKKQQLIELEKGRPGSKEKTTSELADAVEQRLASLPKRLRWIYWVSPPQGHAVLRHERRTVEGELTARYSNDSLQSVTGTEIVLARHVIIEKFGRFTESGYRISDSPHVTRKLSVVNISTDSISPKRFSLTKAEVSPGMRVIDAVTPGLQKDGRVITFLMPDDPEDLESTIAVAKAEHEP